MDVDGSSAEERPARGGARGSAATHDQQDRVHQLQVLRRGQGTGPLSQGTLPSPATKMTFFLDTPLAIVGNTSPRSVITSATRNVRAAAKLDHFYGF